MKILDQLSPPEKELLLKFPAYITLLATNIEDHMEDVKKKEAVKFAHIKTYSPSDPILHDFYEEADKVFDENIIKLDKKLPKGKKEREQAIKNKLAKLEGILNKLGKEYAVKMKHSMESFKEHVSKSHRNVLEFFLFPVPIKGYTD
jgi:hypothetical protein